MGNHYKPLLTTPNVQNHQPNTTKQVLFLRFAQGRGRSLPRDAKQSKVPWLKEANQKEPVQRQPAESNILHSNSMIYPYGSMATVWKGT